MFSNDDNSGLGTFLACMIVVVLAGVGLSLVFDGSIRLSRGERLIKEELDSGASELSHLSQQLSTLEVRLKEEGDARRHSGESLRLARESAELAAGRKRALAQSIESIKSACTELENDLANYRLKSREIRWRQAVGRSLGVVRLKSGREFRQVVVARVTADGLDIRHESGVARLAAWELEPYLQDEFQLDATEPAHGGGAAPASSGAAGLDPALPGGPGAASGSLAGPRVDDRAIVALRARVSAWKTKLGSLKSQRAEALSRASYGGEKSVPGSLETWSQRADSLAAMIARAEQELAKAAEALAAVAPDDPLLRRAP